MIKTYLPRPSQRRSIAIAATVALHLALLAGWHMARTPPPPDTGAHDEPYELRLIALKPLKPVRPEVPPPGRPVPRVSAAATRAPVNTPQAISREAKPQSAAVAEPAPVAALLEPAKSADTIMQQARRDIGKIDRDLRKAYPGGPIKAPADSPQIRLEKAIELAHDMAPPGLFEAPKVKEIIDPGQYGRRRYRVITALGTYCLTHESNRGNDGQDPFTANRLPKKSNCPPHEQPATQQKW